MRAACSISMSILDLFFFDGALSDSQPSKERLQRISLKTYLISESMASWVVLTWSLKTQETGFCISGLQEFHQCRIPRNLLLLSPLFLFEIFFKNWKIVFKTIIYDFWRFMKIKKNYLFKSNYIIKADEFCQKLGLVKIRIVGFEWQW